MSDLAIGLWAGGVGVAVFVIVLAFCHDPYEADRGLLLKAIKAERRANRGTTPEQ